MQEESDLELEVAHKFALREFNGLEQSVLVFELNGKTYISKIIRSKLKTKLVFEAVVKAIGHKNSGTTEKPAYVYLFEVCSNRFKETSQEYFTPKEMYSERLFSNKLMGMVSFLHFLGNTKEFRQYISSEISRMSKAESQISATNLIT